MPLQVLGFSEEADIIAESKPNAVRQNLPERQYRTVVCFDCQHVHKVSGMSTSSLCPNCGSYIDLRDVVIKDRTTQKIRTRGDVIVEKKGALLGTSITCGNLTVEGQVAGSIYASGTVTFRNSGKVLGEVRCHHLHVEKKCEIQFLQPIHTDTAEIFGEANGRFTLTGRMFLNRRSSLHGSLEAKSLLMEAGAKISGPVQILPKPLPPPPSLPFAAVVSQVVLPPIDEQIKAPLEPEIPDFPEDLVAPEPPILPVPLVEPEPPKSSIPFPIEPAAVAAESLAFWAAESEDPPAPTASTS